MKKIILKSVLIALILTIVFIFLTPLTLFFNYSIIISMIEGLIISFVLFLIINSIESVYQLVEFNSSEKAKDLGTVLVPFVLFIIFAIILYNAMDARLNSKIENEGVFTSGKINNGQHLTRESLRRGKSNSYAVEISFTDTITNKDYRVRQEVSRETYDLLYVNQIIELKYLKSNPTIYKLMIGNDNINRFKKISNKNIDITNIEYLFKNIESDKNLEYLNSISQGWTQTADVNGILFVNELKKETIGITKEGKIYYEGENIDLILSKLTKLSTLNFKNQDENVIKSQVELYEYNTLEVIYFDRILLNRTPRLEKYLLFEQKI